MNTIVSIAVVVVALIALFYFVNQNNQQTQKKIEMMENYKRTSKRQNNDNIMPEDPLAPRGSSYNVTPSAPLGQNETYKAVGPAEDPNNAYGLNGNQFPNDCFPKDQLNPADLLPGDANSTWAQVAPNGQGELGDQNFLSSGYHVGINTVGSSLRNANMQLRSDPPCPQVTVSPWLQSTIAPDLSRLPLEIGT
jgi:hypothetical protein